jgi:ribose transport system substrate-binding protein
MKRGAAAVVAVGMLAAVSACGGAAGGSDSAKDYDPGHQSVTGVDEKSYPVDKPGKKYVIGVTMPAFTIPFWVQEAYGAQQEADRLGVELRINAASGYGDTAGQLKQIDTYVTQGVDALIVGAVDSKGIAPAVDRAWSQGIPVSYATALANSSKSMGVYTDDKLAGVRQADYIASKDPEAKVIAMCGPAGVVWTKLRCDAFVAELKAKAPKAEVLAQKYHDLDRAVAAQVAGNTLQAFPQATWVFNATNLQAMGVVDALRSDRKKPGDVQVTTLTIDDESFGLMKQGWINAALAERPVLQGKLAVDRVVLALEGKKAPASWAVNLPLFVSDEQGLAAFDQTETKWNVTPKGYKP